ncbi:3-ketodihydrosphingosine reductase, Tsc10 [Metarhizium album ARSEF 1941]|uniref:3-dehydrosphinganine reductase n=1 Tax=Metarhizium album (strain ARSEF 1941) TaxID=1081103 RepID=A0A0B2X1D6_METAS|nr:3-ketodihydrosphingosine reductase, Tsc10 [Metarhizium album ARSEF 1941]KHN99679.1 3-ketodihydrosphingosine reductase, Tsc10 [Metarhizium album ARSEF 1941]
MSMDYVSTRPSPWILIPTAVATLVAFSFAMGLFSGNKMPTVLITGGSEGLGLAVAQQLAAKGANIILVSRSTAKLHEALKSVKASAKSPSQRFHHISADVSSPSYATPLIAAATAWNNDESPDIVWCCAGTSSPQLFTEMEMDSLRRHMDVNFYGTAEMSHAILRSWLSPSAPVTPDSKHLIFTTSTIAFYTVPGYAPYAPSKWALRGLADTLSQEVMMYPQNVKVHVVCPGTILSPGFVHEDQVKPEITKILEATDPRQTPEEVAAASIKALENGDYLVTVNWLGNLMRLGMLGGSFRNNWVVDTLGAWLVAIVWIFVQPDLHGKIRAYGKEHGHPTMRDKQANRA